MSDWGRQGQGAPKIFLKATYILQMATFCLNQTMAKNLKNLKKSTMAPTSLFFSLRRP
jgi:hypothetical protein